MRKVTCLYVYLVRFRQMREAHEQLMAFMRTQVRDRKTEIQGRDGDRNDVFTMLVKANESESEKLKLDDEELVRTCSTFLLLH